ncbi:MAG: hypothetical protein H6581_03665 [Bacteroidia bacterium]|nr:hypothetical protein [Bacteroidia bacterium]
MELFKYISLRVLIVALFVVISNQIYIHTFWKQDINKHGDILENFWLVEDSSDALYFGESSNFHVPEGDTVKHRISHLLDDLLPEIRLGTVDNAGLHAGTYLAVIKNIKPESKIKLLIITLNLRSFTATWRYSLSENYLAKTEEMIAPRPPLFNRFMVSLKNYDYRPDEERKKQYKQAWATDTFNIPGFHYHTVAKWDSAMAWKEWIGKNPNLREEDIPLASHYIKNFAFSIDTSTNERIADFDEIMEISRKRGYKVVLNLLDENMEEGRKLVGDELIYLMERNRRLLVDRYEKKGALVVDNMYSMPDSCFVDRHWPTEHYDLTGKTLIARKIAKTLREKGLLREVFGKGN